MEKEIENLILEFVRNKNKEGLWRDPLVGYASASDPLFRKLREVSFSEHFIPEDILPEAKTVIVFFVPFEEKVIESNISGNAASRLWAYSYVKTNQLLSNIAGRVKEFLVNKGIKSEIIPPTHNFDRKKLLSRWSHRHAGYIAGLGRFGLNNMLITQSGCAGRACSLIINIEIEPTQRSGGEYCLYHKGMKCTVCVERCVNGSLSTEGFNRFDCWQKCLENGEMFSDLNSPSVCGKCVVGLPCTYSIPKNYHKN